jgi:hypothetical protein
MSEIDDNTATAVGKACEALEWVERARGHLYEFHHLMGRADQLFGEAANALDENGCSSEAARLQTNIVGRNVLDGRWTFQVVEEFDNLYWSVATAEVRGLERDLTNGLRHVYESRMKDKRRTPGLASHAARPVGAVQSDVVALDLR